MNEETYNEKEKELAKRLGDFLDGGALPEYGAEGIDPELDVEIDTACALLGMFGGAPELKPEFDQALRARLVREAGRRGKTRRPSTVMRSKWVQVAVAAAFIIVLGPTLWMFGDKASEARKLEKIQEYDKMYVPFSQQVAEKRYGADSGLFSEAYSRKVREMASSVARKRAASYYANYRKERRYGQ